MNKKKLKILHLAKFFDPQKGGIETITSLLVNQKSKLYRTTVIYFGKEDRTISKSDTKYICTKTLFTLLSQPFSLSYILMGINEIRKADIIHIHSPNFLAYIITLLSNHKKIVLHWHSDVILNLKRFVSFIEKSILNRSSHIICSSEKYKNTSISLNNYKDKLVVIPYGIKKIGLRRSKIRKKIQNIVKKNNKKNIVISVGRLVGYKGYFDLIDSSKYFDPSVITLIVGDGPEKEKLFERIKLNKVNNKVFLISNINDDELSYLYEHSKLYLCFSNSRKESFGISLIEAQSHGIPIIARKITGSGVNWVNKNNKTGYNIDINDEIKVANRINTLLKDSRRLKVFSKNATERFNSTFKFNKMISKVHKIYQNLANN